MQSVQRKGYLKVRQQTKSVITNNNNCYARNLAMYYNPSLDLDGHQLSKHINQELNAYPKQPP